MKHIEKDNNKIPAVYAKELKEKGLDEASILANPTLTDTGAQLYDQVRAMDSYKIFRHSLAREQGYVCCYCNRSISENDMVMEHVKPKRAYRHLVGEYKNLLISCSGNQHIPSGYTRATWPLHCDASKLSNPIPISPLEDCESHFIYEVNGKIKPVSGDVNAQTTISTLKLDCVTLEIERRNEINSWLYDSSGNAYPRPVLERVFDTMMKRHNGRYMNFHYIIALIAYRLIG